MADQYECLGPADASMIKVRMSGQVVTLLGRKHSKVDDNSWLDRFVLTASI